MVATPFNNKREGLKIMEQSFETMLALLPLQVNVDRDARVIHICGGLDDLNGTGEVVSVSFDSIPLLIKTLERVLQD